ncbi:hypothetical protein ABZ897_27915 [Nonomuraea sp. NPDC046802]|uniref:hypothetical protein n=1 Tax=Nonomuraea sp. NPDC046802 TaxID=3154919 RepID=UPI0034103B37
MTTLSLPARVAPAVGLWFLAPLIAEYLMGNMPITNVAALIPLTIMYGGGALLIREFVRRTGRGWPAMMVFGTAYGMIEEAFITQTLWSESWYDVRILDYGYLPALGTALPWVLFMVGVHTVWSISVPIAIMETLAGPRRTTPWLGTTGFRVLASIIAAFVLLVVGYVVIEGIYLAGPPQYAGAALAIAAIIAIGLRLRGGAPGLPGSAPSPWSMLAFALAAGAFFVLLYATDPTGLSPWLARALPVPPWLSVLLYLALFAVSGVLVSRWSRREGWSQAHRLALAAGAVLTYAWHSFPWKSIVPASLPLDLTSNAIMTAGAIALLVAAALRAGRNAS